MLPVTLAGVKLLCGVTDGSQDAGITALMGLAQTALEYALDPAILANSANDAGLLATLALGVTECLAGAYLGAWGRGLTAQGLTAAQTLNTAINGLVTDNAGASVFQQQTFRLSTLEISTKPLFDNFRPEVVKADLSKQGDALAAAGLARLTPFSRSARALARTAAGGDQNLDDQSPVPLLIGAGLGQAGGIGIAGPPADSTFDAVLGTDGRTDPPGGDILGSPFGAFWAGGPEA